MFKELLAYIRAMQIFSQSAHHLVGRTPFHSDHEFFGEVYTELSSNYDAVAERIVGLFGEEQLELNSLMALVAQHLQGKPSTGVKENSQFYSSQLQCEQYLQNLIKQLQVAGVSPGTENLLQGIGEQSEIRTYKIKQRLKK